MSRLLVLYGTTDGHTAKIAQGLAEGLAATGAQVDVVRAGKEGIDPDPADYAGVVVAASVHAGGYQRTVRRWVRSHVVALQTRPTAFVSVCLGILQDNRKVRADLDRILERFLSSTGWRPSQVRIVAGALPYSRYGWFKRWVMRRMARKAGVETDPERDYDFTDWADVGGIAGSFARLAGFVPPAIVETGSIADEPDAVFARPASV